MEQHYSLSHIDSLAVFSFNKLVETATYVVVNTFSKLKRKVKKKKKSFFK